jgi:hypothetical protein
MAFPCIINRRASRRAVCHRIASATAFIAAASAGCSPVFAQQSTSNGSVGIDVIALPRYAGSSAYQVLPLPELTFPIQSVPHTTLFAEGLDGGVAWSLTPNVDLGPLVGTDLGRKQDDATVIGSCIKASQVHVSAVVCVTCQRAAEIHVHRRGLVSFT